MSLLGGDRAVYTVWTWTGGKCSGRDCTWSDGTDWDFDKFGEGILHPNVSQNVFLADITTVLQNTEREKNLTIKRGNFATRKVF